jgi:DNA-binding beta-propeller fold protein YncE
MKRILVIVTLVLATSTSARETGGTPVALLTAERQNQLIAVELPTGKVLRRVTLPADPQNVGALVGRSRTVLVVSAAAGAVTLLDERTLKIRKVVRGFASPHIVAISPFGKWAYVTDDARGELVVIALGTGRIVDRLFVGLGAHHMTIGPNGRRMWIALGERASQIAIVELSHPARPRLLRRFSPRFIAHDLTFAPDGRRVWVTAGAGNAVHVLNPRSGKKVFSVFVGAGPQHVVFAEPEGSAFVTSGYANKIVKVESRTGRIVKTAYTPPGSFNLASSGGLVVTTSLFQGAVTEFDTNLRRLLSVKVAPATRAVAVTVWP